MKKLRTVTFPLLVLILILASCSLFDSPAPAAPPTADLQSQVDAALAATAAVQTQVAFSVQQTVAAGNQGGQPPADPPQPPQPPPQVTDTPDRVTVTVSIDTNCRTGPGTIYDIIGALVVGQTAEVVGRSHNNDNWIIKLPSHPNVTCWLWAYYATTVGNTSALPIIQPPPTPTPSTFNLTIYNNCAITIFYAFISETTDPGWGSDELGASTIPFGGTFTWVTEPGTVDIKVEDGVHTVLYTWMGLTITMDQYLVACP